MKERGHPVVLAIPDDGPLATEAVRRGFGIEVVAVNRMQARFSPALSARQLSDYRRGSQAILDLASRLMPSVAHVHRPVAGIYARRAARLLDIRVLMHIHETLPLPLPYKLVAGQIYPRCSHFVGVSQDGDWHHCCPDTWPGRTW